MNEHKATSRTHPPAFSAVEREITRRIQMEVYKIGERLPAEREFQEEFGFSRPTIAKALSRIESKGLIERYRGRGTFVTTPPSLGKNRKASGVKTAIRVVMPGAREGRMTVSYGVLEGLHETLAPLGVDTVFDFFSTSNDQLEILTRFREEPDAGLVIWPAAVPEVETALAEIAEDGIPLVLIDRYFQSFASDYVVNDNAEGAASMVRHLIGFGHERILYLSLAPYSSSLGYRLGGVVKEMALAGLPINSESIVILPPEGYENRDGLQVERRTLVRETLERVLKQDQPPTVIFASTDALAIEVMSALQEMNIAVPLAMSVAGFDNVDVAEHCAVPLTTVAQDFYRMGVLAGRILLHRIDVENNPYPRVSSGFIHERIEPRLVVRASVERLG